MDPLKKCFKQQRQLFIAPKSHVRCIICRVLDLANKGVANLSACALIVMDEADKLLSPEFQPLIEQIIKFLPLERQILLFSATFPITGVCIAHSSTVPIGPADAHEMTTHTASCSEGFPRPFLESSVRNQSDGTVNVEGCLAILCLRRGATEDPLSQHFVHQGILVSLGCQLRVHDFPLLLHFFFHSCKSINQSSSAILSTAWSYWPRRSLSWDTHASTSTPKCFSLTVIVFSTTSATVHAETWSVQVCNRHPNDSSGIYRACRILGAVHPLHFVQTCSPEVSISKL